MRQKVQPQRIQTSHSLETRREVENIAAQKLPTIMMISRPPYCLITEKKNAIQRNGFVSIDKEGKKLG